MEIKLLRVCRSFVHMEVKIGSEAAWLLTAVYANPQPNVRKDLWGSLDELSINKPWMLVGDFNCVLEDAERSSLRGASSCFKSWVRGRGLIDMGFVGSQFTWKHGNTVESRRAARLDRALCCDEWRCSFPAALVRHLTHAHSDHCPILVELDGEKPDRLGERQFKFQAAWLLHADFMSMLRREWSWGGDLTHSMKCLAEKLNAWNRDTFGNIFWKKRKLRRRLEGACNALEERSSVGLLKLEMKLKRELADVLLQEEVLWMQKSRVDWLRMGDKNTKFFHTSTLARRRRNRVDLLMNDGGEWVSDKLELKNMALDYYKNLFTTDPSAGGEFITGGFPRVEDSLLEELSKDVSEEETWRALKDMGSYKDPGPDGFQAIFFKRTCEVTGVAVHAFVKAAIEEGVLSEEAAAASLVLIPKEDKPCNIRGFRPLSL